MNTSKLMMIIILLFSGVISFGQKTSKIHFFNSYSKITIEVHDGNYLKLKGYSLIETKEDSLFFTNENAPMNIGVEKDKNHYFIVVAYTQSNGIDSGLDFLKSGIKVEEVSEREFFWTLLLNKHGRKPDDVFSY